MYHPDFALNSWQLLQVFHAICLLSLAACIFFDGYLPLMDAICATLPSLADVIGAPSAQALPYIFDVVMGSHAADLASFSWY